MLRRLRKVRRESSVREHQGTRKSDDGRRQKRRRKRERRLTGSRRQIGWLDRPCRKASTTCCHAPTRMNMTPCAFTGSPELSSLCASSSCRSTAPVVLAARADSDQRMAHLLRATSSCAGAAGGIASFVLKATLWAKASSVRRMTLRISCVGDASGGTWRTPRMQTRSRRSANVAASHARCRAVRRRRSPSKRWRSICPRKTLMRSCMRRRWCSRRKCLRRSRQRMNGGRRRRQCKGCG
mmetsp:Transcript_1574/g.5105  ORF Transcript_1574/g.5105 Transcript_1574/m.5105 type:complete len:239 (-) Transcript_1574:43-759(-)